MKASLRHWAARSPHPLAATLRRLRKAWQHFTLPAPRVIVLPMLWLFIALRAIVFFLRQHFLAEPLFKAYCRRHGKGVTCDIHIPWVKGRGELVVGDYVHIDGKINIAFAARFSPNPQLHIGDYTDIGHNCSFVVGRGITIGRHVQIAGGVSFRDSGGHASDPLLRLAGAPPDPADVKPIVVHDNVWIGTDAMILPGAEIGEGSIVVARSIVSGVVAPNTVVAGNPARRVSKLASAPVEVDAPAVAAVARTPEPQTP